MASGVTTRFRGDSKDLEAAQSRVRKGAKGLTDEYKRTKVEANEAKRIVTRALREQETAAERYRRKLILINRAVSQGAITQQQQIAAIRSVANEYREANAAKAQFASPGQLAGLVARLGAVAGAVKLATAALREARKEAEEGAEKIRAGSFSIAELSQVADDKIRPSDFQNLAREARKAFGDAVTESIGEAAKFRFQIRSAQLDDDLALFSRIGTNRVTQELPDLVRDVQQVLTGFREEAGGAERVIAKGLAASTETQANLNQVLQIVARAATTAAEAGFSDEEVFAAATPLASAFGAERGAQRLVRFFVAFRQSGLEAKDLPDAIRQVRKAFDNNQLTNLFGTEAELKQAKRIAELGGEPLGGRFEAREGFNLLEKNMDKFGVSMTKVTFANDNAASIIQKKIDEIRSEVGTDAAIREAQSKNQQQLATRAFAIQEIERRTQIANIDRLQTLVNDVGPVARGANRFIRGAALNFDVEPVLPEAQIQDILARAKEKGVFDEAKIIADLIREGNERTVGLDRAIREVGPARAISTPEPETQN